MSDKRLIKISKYLSYYLRHQPKALGLTLGKGGWVDVTALLKAAAADGFPISPLELETAVATNDKQRFAFDDSGMRIRANQGHSTPIDLDLAPQMPPDLLYHGTGAQFVPAILNTGLKKMARHHVHLSADPETAYKVGSRHGKPVIFQISTAAMVESGFTFYCSANGVWLVEHVPPDYLEAIQP
ncbi:MAG: RNA 2'-phosphotransferase [Cyanobacteria bacterium J06635_15]